MVTNYYIPDKPEHIKLIRLPQKQRDEQKFLEPEWINILLDKSLRELLPNLKNNYYRL